MPSGGAPTMVREGVSSLLDYGVASRGLGNLVHRCNTALGAAWAPRVPVEVSMLLKLGVSQVLRVGEGPPRSEESWTLAPGTAGSEVEKARRTTTGVRPRGGVLWATSSASVLGSFGARR